MKKIVLLSSAFFFCLQFVYSQPGKPDPSFGVNGFVTTGFSKNIPYNSLGKQVIVQPDGSMYIVFEAAAHTFITKRFYNGSIDESYGNKGFAFSGTLSYGHAALQADGKLVVAGSVRTYIGKDPDTDGDRFASDFGVARFNTDGSLDNTFGTNGKVITNFSGVYTGTSDYDVPTSVALQTDGKIVVAGYSTDENSNSDFALARYNADGSLDNTFGVEGKEIFDSQYNDNISSLTIQKNGKIVTASTARDANDFFDDILLMRLNVDGSLDSSFADDGKQNIDFGFTDVATSVAIQPDGKIVVCGGAATSDQTNVPNVFAVARVNTNGSFDSTFSEDGKQTTGFGSDNNIARSIIIQPDGKLVLAGSALVRYNIDGSLDNTFGKDGKQVSDFDILSAAIQNDGKIVSVGSNNNSTYTDFVLTRHHTNGKPDNSFANNGTLAEHYIGGSTIYNSFAVQSDGKIIAVGSAWNGTDSDVALARYNTDGTLDNTFNGNGKKVTNMGFNESGTSIVIQSDGKIVIAGNAVNGNVTTYFLARYNADGRLDNTFSADGKQEADFAFSKVRLQKDGKILVGGSETLARYNSNGTLDVSFNGNGKVEVSVHDFVQQNDGKIVLLKGFNIVRYNTNGSLDSAFTNETPNFGFNDNSQYDSPFEESTCIIIQSDEKIVVGGFVGMNGKYSRNYNPAIVRYNTDGSLDHTFSKDGIEILRFKNSSVNTSIALQSHGQIIVEGKLYYEVSQGGNGRQDEKVAAGYGFARLNNDGSTDSTFGTDGKMYAETENEIQNISIANNKLYAAGFRKQGDTAGLLVRYLLGDSSNTSPTVSITVPANNSTYLAPAAHIKLSANASGAGGSITKVEFYNDRTLLHTETVVPYGYVWKNVRPGNYTLTAKAYNNSGNVTTSAAVHISVIPNKPPAVSIITPLNNQSFAAPAYVHFEAAASDTDGRITRVDFYNGLTLLRTEYKYPYTYVWKNLPVNTYTITAVATDNWGAQTTSVPVSIKVTDSGVTSSRADSKTEKTTLNDALTLRLSPNPVTNILHIYTSGLQKNKQAIISIISVSGSVLKTMQINNTATQLNVSSLVSGVYTIKIISGDKVIYTQFVKL